MKTRIHAVAPAKSASSPRFLYQAILLLWVCFATVDAAETPRLQDTNAKELRTVYVGIYLNQIHALSLNEGYFVADFWLWFRWSNATDFAAATASNSASSQAGGRGVFDPIQSFDLIDGRIESKASETRKTANGMLYSYCRVIGRMTKHFSVRCYPMDQHELVIAVEDANNETDSVVFVPDVENCAINPEICVPGRCIRMGRSETNEHVYRTNFGDPSLPTGAGAVYSRFLFSVIIEKAKLLTFFKAYWPTVCAVLIALLALFINPNQVDPRFGLAVGALFAVIANGLMISSQLPDTSQFVFVDFMQIISVTVILLSVVESIVSLRQCEIGIDYETRVRRMDIRWFAILCSAYAVALVAGLVWYW